MSNTQQPLATFESNFAPKWLIFKDIIINTTKIISVYPNRATNKLHIETDTDTLTVNVTNLEETWSSLQKVFADGVTKKS